MLLDTTELDRLAAVLLAYAPVGNARIHRPAKNGQVSMSTATAVRTLQNNGIKRGDIFQRGNLKWGPIEILEEQKAFYNEFAEALGNSVILNPNQGDRITGRVFEFTNGGNDAIIEVDAKAAGLLTQEHVSLSGEKAQDVLELGQEIEVYVLRPTFESEELRLSRKTILMEVAWHKLQQFKEEDAIFNVRVTAVNRGGALVEFEGARGFMPGGQFEDGIPTESMVGEVVQCKILEMDADIKRLIVSERKAMQEIEKESIHKFSVGMQVEGVVKGTRPFGAFVKVQDGPTALLHISQITNKHMSMEQFPIAIGSPIKAMVINVDATKGQIGLSTKLLEEEEGDFLTNPEKVMENAEEVAKKVQQRVAAEKEAKDIAAKELLASFGNLEDIGSDVEE